MKEQKKKPKPMLRGEKIKGTDGLGMYTYIKTVRQDGGVFVHVVKENGLLGCVPSAFLDIPEGRCL